MQNDSLNNSNPWTEIPLADYERHMLDTSVGQLSLLNTLTKKYLAKIKPATCLFMGIAGGNGLEHINRNVSKNVIGIDINQEYLDVSFKRYNDKIDSLKLLKLDITKNTNQVCSADFIWAALVLEYAGIDKCLEFSKNNILPGGHFIVTIQSNNNLQSVSQTGVESIKKAGVIFKTIEPEIMLVKAKEIGYTIICDEENQLPNGKTFLTFDFVA
ncbi:MAG TPA: class I SAM-dependent methyltransferase [Hanamia sp.]|jgi:Methyltransferase domain.